MKITDATGASITGADVTVKFYMPAMAAMGMAAMDMTTKLSEKGGGNYEGSGKLDSGELGRLPSQFKKVARHSPSSSSAST